MRSLRERLGDLGSRPELIKSVLLFEDIDRYGLPPDFTKAAEGNDEKFAHSGFAYISRSG